MAYSPLINLVNYLLGLQLRNLISEVFAKYLVLLIFEVHARHDFFQIGDVALSVDHLAEARRFFIDHLRYLRVGPLVIHEARLMLAESHQRPLRIASLTQLKLVQSLL